MKRVTLVVTPGSNVLYSNALYDDVKHTSSPRPCLWFGAQTADTDSDWLKQLKRFTAGTFCFWLKQKSFKTVSCFDLIVRTV